MLIDGQDVYSYELHERLVFRANGGLGKIAHVCGDMLSLEELIIHQFPNQLPEYQDYASEGQFYQADAVAGIGAFSLSTQAIKTYESLANDVSLMDGLALIEAPAEIAATIGSAFKDNIDQEFIPSIINACVSPLEKRYRPIERRLKRGTKPSVSLGEISHI